MDTIRVSLIPYGFLYRLYVLHLRYGTGDHLGLYAHAASMRLLRVGLLLSPDRIFSASPLSLPQRSHGLEKFRMIGCRRGGSPG